MPGILSRYPMTSSLLCWALIWELVGRLGLIQLLPPLSQVLVAMGEVVSTATFARAAVETLLAFTVGMAIGHLFSR